ERLPPGIPPGMAQAERLELAPDTVVEVQPEREHRRDVEERHRPAREPRDEVVVDVTLHELRVHGAEGEMRQVVGGEEGEERAAPDHRSRGIGGLAVPLHAVALRARAAALQAQADRGPDVEHDRGEEDRARDPDPRPVEELAQEDRVAVHGLGAEVDLEISREVADHEAEEDEAGDGHQYLATEGGAAGGIRGGGQTTPNYSTRGGASSSRRRRVSAQRAYAFSRKAHPRVLSSCFALGESSPWIQTSRFVAPRSFCVRSPISLAPFASFSVQGM